MGGKKILGFLIIILIVFEIVMAAYLVYKDLTKQQNVCILGSSCETVQDSAYGNVFGIKLPFIGVFAFSLLLIIYFLSKKLFFAGALVGAVASIYLISVQLFVLKQICSNCMIVDGTMLIIFLISVASLFMKSPKQ